MGWMRTHPYATLFAFAGLMFVALVAITLPHINSFNQNPYAPSDGSIFPTSNSVPNVVSVQGAVETPAPRYSASSNNTPTALPTQDLSAATPDTSESAFDAFLASLSTPEQKRAPDTSSTDAFLQEVYALIPSGVTVFGTTRSEVRTPEQQALYEYGNKAGLAILTFENAHMDMADDLKNWFDNRASAAYDAPVVAIANDMIAAGASLASLPSVPALAADANKRLAASLKAAGEMLKAVTAENGDSNIAEAMKTYNTSAEEFTRSYIALADLFTLHEVTFSQSDTGSAFTFSASSF